MCRPFAFVLGGVVAFAAHSVAPNSFAQPPSKDIVRMAEVRFADGSVVRMNVRQETIEVMTKYGKLTIPTDDIRRIDMGLHIPEGLELKIEKSIRNLGSDAFKQREDASKDLLQVGHWAYPALQKAAASPELEVAKRAQSLMMRISEKTPPEVLKIRADDVVQTRDFPVVGRIASPTIKAHSPLFGEQLLKLCDLRCIQLRGQRGDAEISLEAAKYGSGVDQWYDSGIVIDGQLRLSIVAEGSVDLWPQTPGQYIAQPRGYNTPGKGGAFLAGALVGKIGETGRTFLIGERHESSPAEEGKLYLHIVPSPWNNASAGSFRVRVTTEHLAAR
jgi:hypothetical protein